jgi:hypothetical protein
MKSFTTSALAISTALALGAVACSDEGTSSGMASGPHPAATTTQALTDCDGNESTDFTIVDAAITDAQTWSGTVYVAGEVTAASEALLTIEPGTQVIMAQDARLDFATNANATLDASGTLAKPVKFCGEVKRAGSWAGLALGATAEAASRLENVVISDAGKAEEAALTLEGAAMLHAVAVMNAAGDGIHAVDFAENSAEVSVRGSAGASVVLTADDALAHFPSEVTLSGNGDDRVRLRFDELSLDATLSTDVAYVQEGSLAVKGGAVLTMEAGVEYDMDSDASLEIGVGGEQATAFFLGTENAKVTISGSNETSGSWQGIVIGDTASSESFLANVEIRHAGGGEHAALEIDSAITIDHVLVADSDHGVSIDASGLSAESSGLTVTGTASVPLQLEANALVSLPADCALSGNADGRIAVAAGAIASSGAVVNLGLPYEISGDIQITNAASVSIEPGVEFVMADDSQFTVGADGSGVTLTAAGTADATIVFRGETDEPGAWYGMLIESNVSASSSLSHIEIRNAGGGDLALGSALTLETSVAVSDSAFVDSSGSGILKVETDDSDYASQNTFVGVETEVAVAASAALDELN